MSEFISTQKLGNVLIITLNDPTTRNSIGDEMASEINIELNKFESSPHLRTLVITGKDPSFCSGANVKRMDFANREREAELSLSNDNSPWETLEQKWREVAQSSRPKGDEKDGVRFIPLRLHELQKPSIAAVNGFAMGLGMGIALSCDIRIASENAKMSETFINRGLIPADGSCWQLPRMIGLGNTMLLQYTGDVLSADECYRLGIVNKVTTHDNLMKTTLDLAQRIANGPTYSQALIKRLVQRSLNVDFAESLELAGPAQAIARQTWDHKEGVRAFVEKRRPSFKGN